ncbi:hypothetical protein [Leptothermofonsia sp. ETS-13]|uniref:hypothetical protein n=1 Tax=Leptothermofonsia sp. ETS-13 TaxID=3035696 RepID=UPI003BA177AB
MDETFQLQTYSSDEVLTASDLNLFFTLQADRYTELNLQTPGFWMPTLELGLGLWRGRYHGMERLWLRWYDATEN